LTVRVQTEDFDAAREAAELTRGRTDIGAVVTFTGLVRGEHDGIELKSMTLEHYPDMIEAELGRIEAEARVRFQLTDCIIIHRVGELRPGDNIVLVVTAAPHRHAAFDAAAFLMDYLKTRAPFWKKETDASGAGRWVDARESDGAALDRWKSPAKAAE
jgi:molybdopterin synthase catalytic subunit